MYLGKQQTILLLLVIGQFTYSLAQSYPKGVYKTIEEIIEKTPSSAIELKVEKRTRGEIKTSGGNDFRLVSNDQTLSRKDLKKKVLAYSNGDTLFINCLKYRVQSWYSPILNEGRYLLFVGGISQDQDLFEYQIQETETSLVWGNFGAIGGAIQGAKLAQLRFPYLIDAKTNKLIFFNNYALEKILAEIDLELLNGYRSQKSELRDDEEGKKQLMIDYLLLANKNEKR